MIWEFEESLSLRLLAWAGLSMALGAPLLLLGPDPFMRGVGLMFVVWGAIDGAIALQARRGAARGPRRAPGRAGRDREARVVARLLWVNAALDVGYVAIGAWLLVGPGAADPFVAGCGVGVLVQGGFLLVFDVLHARWVPGPEPELPPLASFEGPEHRSFRLEGRPDGGTAVLLHGFGGTPAELRALGEALQAQGWTVEAPLLPGFGPELTRLTETRYDHWLATAETTIGEGLERSGRPLFLAGHSMGAALAISAARRSRADGLVLFAPFWWQERRWQRLLGPLLRVVLPPVFHPFAKADFDDPETRRGLASFLGELDLDDPAIRDLLRRTGVPLSFVGSIVIGTRTAVSDAAVVEAPTLVIQGVRDEVVTPARTRRLVAAFGRPVELLEVDAGHDVETDHGDAWPEVLGAVLERADEARRWRA